MRTGTRTARLWSVLLVTLGVMGAAAPASNAALRTITGGETELHVDINTVGVLAADQIYQLILPPATVVYSFQPVATFPITGGTVEDTTMLGTVDHSGGIRTVKCDGLCDNGYTAQLDALNPKIAFGNQFTADTNGILTSPVADLVDATWETAPDGTIRYEAEANLNAGAALILNVYFGTSVFQAGQHIGHIKSTILTTTSYIHHPPASAPTVRTALVPVYKECGTAGNPATGSHSPPLAVDSCAPGHAGGTAAHFGPQSVGSARLDVVPYDPNEGIGPDVSIQVTLSDVQAGDGSDYDPAVGPDLTFAARVRLTDLANGNSGEEGATATDMDLPAPVNCTPTSDPALGSTCFASTSAEAVLPGLVQPGAQAILQAFRLRVADSGTNGIRGDTDDRVFAQQGIFAP